MTRDVGARDAGDIPRVTLSQSHDSDSERYALVPIGAARLDDENDDVLLDASAATMAGIPAYDRNALDRDYERNVVRRYTSDDPTALDATGNFYTGRPFDDSTFFGTRRGQRDDSYVRREVDRDDEATALGARSDRSEDDRARRTRERDLLDSPDDLDASMRDQIDRR
jgi:hypothetical protein